ncbi:hypothetical protein J6590_034614 [Homalodisca vitripennis]|nr:hypothetical protein J6590_034614 [Homalodisca vitripennis]
MSPGYSNLQPLSLFLVIFSLRITDTSARQSNLQQFVIDTSTQQTQPLSLFIVLSISKSPMSPEYSNLQPNPPNPNTTNQPKTLVSSSSIPLHDNQTFNR